jgi:hypothetical protein
LIHGNTAIFDDWSKDIQAASPGHRPAEFTGQRERVSRHSKAGIACDPLAEALGLRFAPFHRRCVFVTASWLLICRNNPVDSLARPCFGRVRRKVCFETA